MKQICWSDYRYLSINFLENQTAKVLRYHIWIFNRKQMFRVVKHENKLALSWISWVFIPRTAEPWVAWCLSSVLPSRLNFEWRSSRLGCFRNTQTSPHISLCSQYASLRFPSMVIFHFHTPGSTGQPPHRALVVVVVDWRRLSGKGMLSNASS